MTLVVPVDARVAARVYLRDKLDGLGNSLPVGIVPPAGVPESYVLLSLPGASERSMFTDDWLIRARVFDRDALRCGRNCAILWSLLKAAVHVKVSTPEGEVWISAATSHAGPSDLDDPDVSLFGQQCAVFWTIATKPL
jgi:hypothetical protein